ncbi:MAG TPA: hypothetical protein VNQ76_13270 [Planctomicrobium sp.]|nr:hypothetical protein [Planctomicrobium sp.]
MDFSAIAQLVASVGIPGALTVFFVWQGNIREQRMGSRIDTLETFIRTDLAQQNDTVTEVLRRNTDALDRANTTMSRLAVRLDKDSGH